MLVRVRLRVRSSPLAKTMESVETFSIQFIKCCMNQPIASHNQNGKAKMAL